MLEVDFPSHPRPLDTDLTKVRQILLNLLTNAAKFTERGTIRCRVRSEPSGRRITFVAGGVPRLRVGKFPPDGGTGWTVRVIRKVP